MLCPSVWNVLSLPISRRSATSLIGFLIETRIFLKACHSGSKACSSQKVGAFTFFSSLISCSLLFSSSAPPREGGFGTGSVRTSVQTLYGAKNPPSTRRSRLTFDFAEMLRPTQAGSFGILLLAWLASNQIFIRWHCCTSVRLSNS